MAVTNAGYDSIRNFILSSWKYIELRDATNAPSIANRINAATDARCTWNITNGAVHLVLVLRGTDVDMPIGEDVKGIALYDVATGGSALDEGNNITTTWVVGDQGDKLTITFDLKIPKP